MTKTWRCKQYTDWVKQLPSCVSLRPSDDPHHVINVLPGVMGSKTSDLFTIPLTRDEHNDIHHKGAKQWERENHISQAEECLKIIDYALSQGIIEIKFKGEK